MGPGLDGKMVASRPAHANEYSPGLQLQCVCPQSEPQQTLPLQETLQYQQIGLAQALMMSLLFFPVTWCTRELVSALQEWGFCFP